MLTDNFNCINSFSLGDSSVKIPPKSGENGKNIHGEVISPPPVADVGKCKD